MKKLALILLIIVLIAILPLINLFSTKDITGKAFEITPKNIEGITCSSKEFPIEDITIVSGLEGEIPDNKNRIDDKIFDYDEFNSLHMYAVIKGSDGKYYLGYQHEAVDRYPTQANINGRIVNLYRWDSNNPLPDISWSTYKKITSLENLEKATIPNYYIGWEGIIILSQCMYGGPDAPDCNNYQPIDQYHPRCKDYAQLYPYDPECLDYNVGTNRFRAVISKSPTKTLQSNLHRISRKGNTGNDILNTVKLFHGNILQGVGSCSINIEELEWADCADLHQGIAFYMGFIDRVYDIGTAQLGSNERLVIRGRTITEPRTDWGQFYKFSTVSGVNLLDVSFNQGILYVLDADRISGDYVNQVVDTYLYEPGRIYRFSSVPITQTRQSPYGALPSNNGFSSLLVTRDYIFIVDLRQGYQPKNIDFLHIYTKDGTYIRSISMKGPFDSYKSDSEITDLDSDPKDVAFDARSENIYVLIEDFSTIMKFNLNGEPSNWEGRNSNAIFIGKLLEGVGIPQGQIGIHYENQEEISKQPNTMIYHNGKLYIGFSNTWPDGLIRIFDAQNGAFINEIRTDASLSLAVDKSSNKLYGLGTDKIIEFDSDGIIHEYQAARDFPNRKLDVDNGLAFIIGDDGSLVTYNLQRESILASLPKRQTALNKYNFDGTLVESNIQIPIGNSPNQLHPGDFFVMGYPTDRRGESPQFSHTIGFYRDVNNNGYLDENDLIYQSTSGGSLGGSGAVNYDFIRSSHYLNEDYFVVRKWKESA